jgi:hypothetical protein
MDPIHLCTVSKQWLGGISPSWWHSLRTLTNTHEPFFLNVRIKYESICICLLRRCSFAFLKTWTFMRPSTTSPQHFIHLPSRGVMEVEPMALH